MEAAKKKVNKNMVVSRVVDAELSNLRRSRAKTKERGDVSGGGKKPFRQKGTGRARAGSSRSPIWRGGGVTFGPTGHENFQKSVNKKERALARKIALESRKDQTISVTLLKITKTKEAAAIIAKNKLEKPLLVLASDKIKAEEIKNLHRFFRNIKDVKLTTENQVSTLEILKARSILVFKETATKSAAPKTAAKTVAKGKK